MKKNELRLHTNQSVFRIIRFVKRWSLSLSLLAVLKRWSSSIIDLLLVTAFGCFGCVIIGFCMIYNGN